MSIPNDSAKEMRDPNFTLGYIRECISIAQRSLANGDESYASEMLEKAQEAFSIHRASLIMIPDGENAVPF